MACGGCGRRKQTSGTRQKSPPTPKQTKIVVSNIKLTEAEISVRKKKCSRCPFNTLNGLAGRCKKVNRMVGRATQDPSFKCPIKRF